MESLRGVVDGITFQSPDGNFVVFRLDPEGDSRPVVVVGNVPVPFVGEQVTVTGEWVEHARFGRQFRAATYQRLAPASAAGIERFLASGAIKGVGPVMAARLVAHFGLDTLRIIEQAPQRLTEVEGIGPKKAETIHRSYTALSEMRELMLFLEMHGVSSVYAGKIFAVYGSQAVAVLEENPYRLAEDVASIGFRTADQIAMSLGMEPNHPARLTAGVHFALLQTANAGHCCVPEEVLVEEAAKLLRVDKLNVAMRVAEMIKSNALYVEDFHGLNLVYPPHLYYAERRVAERLKRLRDWARPVLRTDYENIVAEWEATAGIALAAAQRQAITSALAHGVLVITGGPGTGKTTTVKGILAVLEAQGFKILLGAPTGRAAKRLGEACGRDAQTIHRLLEATGGEGPARFARNQDRPLDADVVIIDEVSMVDITLMNYLLQAVPEGCRVILVGDVDQLPAVGPGAVLKDIIRSGTIPVVRLTEVFRQADTSIIVVNAHRINRGLVPDCLSSPDFQFYETESDAATAEEIISLCQERLPAEGFDVWQEVQVLSPMHRLLCGVENLNKELQAALNPPAPGKPEISGANQLFRLGDKVMQIRNNYQKGVFNGDVGLIAAMDDAEVLVSYPDGDVVYDRSELDEIRLAYAMSVHKSQGCEYPVIILPLVPGHYIMLQRNLLYTAITRAKQRVILLGSKAALNTALANDRTRRRYSLLAERLRGEGIC